MTHAYRSDVASAHPVAGDREDPDEVTGWVGWVLFGGVILIVVGLFNAFEGLVALLRASYYRVGPSGLVFELDYTVWGWILLAFGVLLAGAGFGVMAGQTWARVVAVIVAVLNALANMAFLAAYPIWSVLVIALDVIVVYAVVVHGREAKALRS